MIERKKLADILLNSDRDKLGRIWESTKAADDLKPLPSGEYRCSVASGELFNAKSGTPGYKLKLIVLWHVSTSAPKVFGEQSLYLFYRRSSSLPVRIQTAVRNSGSAARR